MNVRNRMIGIAVTVGLALPVMTVATSAQAQPVVAAKRPAVSAHFERRDITTADQPTMAYSIGRLPKRAKAVVQLKAGRSWLTVARAHRGSGQVTFSPRPRGSYTYRVAVIRKVVKKRKHKKRVVKKVVAQAKVGLRVFGRVSLVSLMDANYSDAFTNGGDKQVGSVLRHFTFLVNSEPDDKVLLGITRTSCNFFHIEGAFSGGYSRDADPVPGTLLSLVGGTPVGSLDVPYATWTSFDQAVATGGNVQFNARTEVMENFIGDGYAYCLTSNGRLPK